MFKLKRITRDVVHDYVGHLCLFRNNGVYYTKKIKRVSPSGKTIYIDHPPLHNFIQVLSRAIYVIVEEDLDYFVDD